MQDFDETDREDLLDLVDKLEIDSRASTTTSAIKATGRASKKARTRRDDLELHTTELTRAVDKFSQRPKPSTTPQSNPLPDEARHIIRRFYNIVNSIQNDEKNEELPKLARDLVRIVNPKSDMTRSTWPPASEDESQDKDIRMDLGRHAGKGNVSRQRSAKRQEQKMAEEWKDFVFEEAGEAERESKEVKVDTEMG